MDLNALAPQEIVELAHEILNEHSGEEKTASQLPYGVDLNELDVDEFLEFASSVEEEMSKEAGLGRAYLEALKGTRAKAAKPALESAKRTWKHAKGYGSSEGGKKAKSKAKRSLREARKEYLKGRGAQAAAIGGTAAAPAAAGVVAMRRRKKGKK